MNDMCEIKGLNPIEDSLHVHCAKKPQQYTTSGNLLFTYLLTRGIPLLLADSQTKSVGLV